MKPKLLFISFVLALLSACTTKSKHTGEELPLYRVGDVLNKIEEISLDHFAQDIRIIPLETKNEVLMDFRSVAVYLYKDLLYVRYNYSRCSVFNLEGKYLYDIGKKGSGPYEHTSVTDFYFRDNHIALRDMLASDKFILFTLDGVPVKEWKAPRWSGIYTWLEDELFVDYIQDMERIYPEKVIFSDMNGKAKRIYYNEKKGPPVKERIGTPYYGEGAFYRYNNKTFLSMGVNDTVYWATPDYELKPAYIVDLAGERMTDEHYWAAATNAESKKKKLISAFFENNRYVLMNIGWPQDFEFILVDKKTGEPKCVRVKSNDSILNRIQTYYNKEGNPSEYFRFRRNVSEDQTTLIAWEMPKTDDFSEEENPVVILVKMKDE